jgi:hypothetical protein
MCIIIEAIRKAKNMPERFFGNSGGKGGEAEREERVEIR